MYTTIAKILFLLYAGFLTLSATGQVDNKDPLDYNHEYEQFISNYNEAMDVMLDLGSDAEASFISENKKLLPILDKAQIHLQNCLVVAPEDEKLKAVLIGYQEKLDLLYTR